MSLRLDFLILKRSLGKELASGAAVELGAGWSMHGLWSSPGAPLVLAVTILMHVPWRLAIPLGRASFPASGYVYLL